MTANIVVNTNCGVYVGFAYKVDLKLHGVDNQVYMFATIS